MVVVVAVVSVVAEVNMLRGCGVEDIMEGVSSTNLQHYNQLFNKKKLHSKLLIIVIVIVIVVIVVVTVIVVVVVVVVAVVGIVVYSSIYSTI